MQCASLPSLRIEFVSEYNNTMRILFVILLLASLLRFWAIGQNPPSLTWDEAAWGYNAYSLGIDGRDEFGRFLPITYLESFGDYKPPMYAYLDIIPVKILGLNEFSVRFPSAFFGVLTVLISYFLVKEIFRNSKLKIQYALFSSLFLAISPWHIMLSRAAFEANVASFFIVLGILLFLLGMRSNHKFIALSFISFVLSMYTFNTARIVSPLIVISLFFLFGKNLYNIKKDFVKASLIPFVLFLPLVGFLISPQASLRFKEVNIFSDIGFIDISNAEVKNDNSAFFSKVIHNRRFIYSVEYLKHYFDNLTPNFLFGKGDGNPKFSIQEVGQLYLWDLPFLIAGIIFLIRKKEGYWYILPLWLILGIIPAATARETPHALRIETTLPTFQIFVAYGLVNIFYNLKLRKNLIGFLFGLFLFVNFLYFIHGLFVHYPKEFSGEWQYGYRDSINYVSKIAGNYKQINVTDILGRPYIYYLFYEKVDPKEFRRTALITRDKFFGFVTIDGFGKYRFGRNLDKLSGGKGNLYVAPSSYGMPQKSKLLKVFYLLNGDPILKVYTKPYLL